MTCVFIWKHESHIYQPEEMNRKNTENLYIILKKDSILKQT